MQSLSTELKAVIGRRLDVAPASEIIKIASALCAAEPAIANTTQEAAVVRFEVVDQWSVRDNSTGLIWTREPVAGGKRNWKDSMEAASKVDFGGHTWRAPTIKEQLTLVDYDRHDPAIDPLFVCAADWFWTSKVDCESPGDCAWYVDFLYGNSFRDTQGYSGFVRAVRVGQF